MSKKFTIPSHSEIQNAKSNRNNPTPAIFQKRKQSEQPNESIIEENVPKQSSEKVMNKTSTFRSFQSDSKPTVPTVTPVSANSSQSPEKAVDKSGTYRSFETVNRPQKPLVSTTTPLLVNSKQRGNPILKHIHNVAWEYSDIVPDYILGQTTCALFLSLRYHQLHPGYIHERLKLLGRTFELRVLLAQVDIKDSSHICQQLANICLLADCTLILAFTPEEAGRYLELYKAFENKPPDLIMEKSEESFEAKLIDTLTSVKKINKTDAITLYSTFGSVKNIFTATEEDLSLCSGIGPLKAKRLHKAFNEPFIKNIKKKAIEEVNSTEVKEKCEKGIGNENDNENEGC
ncbi:DgyrCDS7476 [Dimorphilus gyrociliatus]|uniref:DNA excision repair protein ERCC-1 n=1 Tax=Dimorphilus gyrociliatus TaxID=2664684 RepID=A0A7I8VSV2_9ANNE|nr:DgyrCDS7476 [Dimorphilus gyrociliatus]